MNTFNTMKRLAVFCLVFCLVVCFEGAIVIGAGLGFRKGKVCFAAENIQIVIKRFSMLCQAYPDGTSKYIRNIEGDIKSPPVPVEIRPSECK